MNLTMVRTPPALGRVSEMEGSGLNRPQLSVPRFHFAPHQTGRTDFPYPAFRVASLQGIRLVPTTVSWPPVSGAATGRIDRAAVCPGRLSTTHACIGAFAIPTAALVRAPAS